MSLRGVTQSFKRKNERLFSHGAARIKMDTQSLHWERTHP